MDFLFGSAKKVRQSIGSIFFSPEPDEKNPIRTPPSPSTPKPETPNRVSFRKGFEIPGANGTTDRVVLPYEKKGPSPKISGRKSAKKGMLAKKTAPVKNITPAKKTASARKVVVERKTPTPKKKVNLKGAAKKVIVNKRVNDMKKNVSRIKSEAMRSAPRRSAREGMKRGHYNEKRLADLVWKGTGSSSDPIQFA